MNNTIIDALLKLAIQLNKRNVKWAVGGSLLLYFQGMDIHPNDVDIIVDNSSYDALVNVLSHYSYSKRDLHPKYKTKHFYQFNMDGVDFDIMVDFCIITNNEVHQIPFHVEETILVKNVPIPLDSISRWRQMYLWMERSDKATNIDAYMKK